MDDEELSSCLTCAGIAVPGTPLNIPDNQDNAQLVQRIINRDIAQSYPGVVCIPCHDFIGKIKQFKKRFEIAMVAHDRDLKRKHESQSSSPAPQSAKKRKNEEENKSSSSSKQKINLNINAMSDSSQINTSTTSISTCEKDITNELNPSAPASETQCTNLSETIKSNKPTFLDQWLLSKSQSKSPNTPDTIDCHDENSNDSNASTVLAPYHDSSSRYSSPISFSCNTSRQENSPTYTPECDTMTVTHSPSLNSPSYEPVSAATMIASSKLNPRVILEKLTHEDLQRYKKSSPGSSEQLTNGIKKYSRLQTAIRSKPFQASPHKSEKSVSGRLLVAASSSSNTASAPERAENLNGHVAVAGTSSSDTGADKVTPKKKTNVHQTSRKTYHLKDQENIEDSSHTIPSRLPCGSTHHDNNSSEVPATDNNCELEQDSFGGESLLNNASVDVNLNSVKRNRLLKEVVDMIKRDDKMSVSKKIAFPMQTSSYVRNDVKDYNSNFVTNTPPKEIHPFYQDDDEYQNIIANTPEMLREIPLYRHSDFPNKLEENDFKIIPTSPKSSILKHKIIEPKDRGEIFEATFNIISKVIIIHGTNLEKFNTDKIFNVFCLYGKIIKIHFISSNCVNLEMGNKKQAENAIKHLNGIIIAGTKFHLSYSELECIKDVYYPGKLPDTMPTYKNYRNHSYNRFTEISIPTLEQWPTNTLYFYNAPQCITSKEIQMVFQNSGVIMPCYVQIKSYDSKSSAAGIISFTSTQDALDALLACNHAEILSRPINSILKLRFFVTK